MINIICFKSVAKGEYVFNIYRNINLSIQGLKGLKILYFGDNERLSAHFSCTCSRRGSSGGFGSQDGWNSTSSGPFIVSNPLDTIFSQETLTEDNLSDQNRHRKMKSAGAVSTENTESSHIAPSVSESV